MNNKKVILFSAIGWCSSCRKIKPLFRCIAKQLENDNIVFSDVDVETNDGVELSTKYEVRNVPTILIVSNDVVVKRINGMRTEQELIEEIKSVL